LTPRCCQAAKLAATATLPAVATAAATVLPPPLPLPSPCCRRRCRPATPLPATAVLPPPQPPCCCCRPRLLTPPPHCWPLPRCLHRSAGAATLLPPPTRRQAERKLPPPLHFRQVARHAAAKLPPPPPRTPRENQMTQMDPQKGGKTSYLAAAKRGRGLGCAFRFLFRFLPGLIFRNSGYSAEFPGFRRNTRRN
jgi:hypothetical protein